MRRFLLCLPFAFLAPALVVFPIVALAQGDAGPVLTPDDAARLLDRAILGKEWALLASLAVVGVVFVLRRVGARLWAWLGTPKGAVFLSMVGGTATALALALGAGATFSLGLLLSCFMTAAGASGLFSWAQTALRPKASGPTVSQEPPPVCSPRDVADGKC